ncbi:MAG TPA: serine/threonine-protein kinase [Granulicella sp.]|nr:serine/threonine-protein kinase [Granulicella sp.]
MSSGLPQEVLECLQGLERDYSDFERIERGGCGYLWFARNRISQLEVAIKFYSGETGERRHDEPKLLSQIQSPNVLQIYEARDVSQDWAYFVTPRCRGGDLDDLIKSRPSVHESIDTVLGISHGVSAIHSMGMVHRDLKPGNIVLYGQVPRIADFGTVRVLEQGSSVTTASQHSGLYRPPESFATGQYSRAGDVYQIGLVAYQLLGGVLSYDGRDYLSVRERRAYDAIQDHVDQCVFVNEAIQRKAENRTLADFLSLPPWVTGAAKRVLRQMMDPDPSQRTASMGDVAAAMSKLRGACSNWRFVGDVARLSKEAKVVEIRPTATGEYEAFQQGNGTFRRVPGMRRSTLAELVRSCS